jgi:sRNA-binding protein
MAEGKNNVEATIAELAKVFPTAFTLDSSLVRPLKLGIKNDIYARSDMSHRRITTALRAYCRSADYLTACAEGAVRVDLAGERAGSVTGSEAAHAAQALALFSKRSAKRANKAVMAPRGTKLPVTGEQKLASLTTAVVRERSSKDKPATGFAKAGSRRLSLEDLRKAAAARKSAR